MTFKYSRFFALKVLLLMFVLSYDLVAQDLSVHSQSPFSEPLRDGHHRSTNEVLNPSSFDGVSPTTYDHDHGHEHGVESFHNGDNLYSAFVDSSSFCGNNGRDGEGCAFLTEDFLVAGSNSTFSIFFKAGASGIPIGGGISVGFHHGSNWPIQTVAPNTAGYSTISSSNSENFQVELHPYAPAGMLSNFPTYNSDWIFHKVLVAKVLNRPVTPGEIVEFVFGANSQGLRVQRYGDIDHQFRITTDIDGDGKYKGILDSPVLEVKHANGNLFSATAPSQVKVDEPFEVFIRLEDENYNVDESYQGIAILKDETGQILDDNLSISNGTGKVDVALSTVGAHRLRIETIEGRFAGRSNPIRVFQTLPEQRLYWADLHGHTGVSDGLGKDAVEYFAFGRDVAALDIIALTDHGHFDWPANIEAVKSFYEPGEYVTLLAQEAGTSSGHMNLYYRRDDTAHIARWHSSYQEFLDETVEQYNSNSQTPEAMTAPHHFAYPTNDLRNLNYPFEIWDDRIARFIEVYSSHGTSEYIGNPRPLGVTSQDPNKYMQGALAMGLKFGVIGASDNHDSRPGRSIWGPYPGGLAGVWAQNLTRESVWNSLWNRSTYGTSIDRIYMDFAINGEQMGSEIEANQPINISAYIIGKTDNLKAVLIKNNEEIHTEFSSNGVIEIDFTDDPVIGSHNYYIRVTQDNGERAWSTPIWVSRIDDSEQQTEQTQQTQQTGPTVNVTNPVHVNQDISNGKFFISGTVQDTGNSGLKRVQVALRNISDNSWVNTHGINTAWSPVDATLIHRSVHEGNWFLSVDLPPDNYRVLVRAVDNAGNYPLNNEGKPEWVSVQFSVSDNPITDLTPPSVDFVFPAVDHQLTGPSITFEGTATDFGGEGLDSVYIAIYNFDLTSWVNLNGIEVDWEEHSAHLTMQSENTANWTLNANLPAGNYRVFARGVDVVGNQSFDSVGNLDWESTSFIVSASIPIDETAPNVLITTPLNAHQTLLRHTPLHGTVADVGGAGIREVRVAIRDSDSHEWVGADGGTVNWLLMEADLIFTSPQDATWHLPVSLPEGNFRVFVYAIDNNGNFAVDTFNNVSWTSKPFTVNDVH